MFQRRTIWIPTFRGALLLLAAILAPVVFWIYQGEYILSSDHPVQEEILVVDGWIKEDTISTVFQLPNFARFKYIIATGGYSGESWTKKRWSYAETARDILKRHISPDQKLILAQAPDSEKHRTYTSAFAVKEAINRENISLHTLTVYTRGAHASRSRMIYQKVFGSDVSVGVISWRQPGFERLPWWTSSARAEDLLKETVGCLGEWLFDSGR